MMKNNWQAKIILRRVGNLKEILFLFSEKLINFLIVLQYQQKMKSFLVSRKRLIQQFLKF